MSETVLGTKIRAIGDLLATSADGPAAARALGNGVLAERWVERLENGPKGRDDLRALADNVFELWRGRPRSS